MRGDERLPQADAAVAGRHLGVKYTSKFCLRSAAAAAGTTDISENSRR